MMLKRRKNSGHAARRSALKKGATRPALPGRPTRSRVRCPLPLRLQVCDSSSRAQGASSHGPSSGGAQRELAWPHRRRRRRGLCCGCASRCQRVAHRGCKPCGDNASSNTGGVEFCNACCSPASLARSGPGMSVSNRPPRSRPSQPALLGIMCRLFRRRRRAARRGGLQLGRHRRGAPRQAVARARPHRQPDGAVRRSVGPGGRHVCCRGRELPKGST